MVEFLKIHSVLFDITERLGYGKDIGFAIVILMFIVLIFLDYAYLLSGFKIWLLLNTALGLLCPLLLYWAAVQVTLSTTPEVVHITRILVNSVLLNAIIVIGYRLLKTKLLNPIKEIHSQKEFSEFLAAEKIDPDSPEAREMKRIWDLDVKDIIKLINATNPDIYFDDLEENPSKIHS